MKTQSIDTSPDAERVLIGMLRSAPISRRFRIVQSWSCSMVEAGRFDVRQLYPQATMQEVWLLYAERRYGKGLVNELRTALQQRKEQFSGVLNFQAVLIPLVEVLRQLDITYALDLAYLNRWAVALGVSDLLEYALAETNLWQP